MKIQKSFPYTIDGASSDRQLTEEEHAHQSAYGKFRSADGMGLASLALKGVLLLLWIEKEYKS